ncbi:MAG: hypothetical protein EZS28_009074 [Streblomastix strix]|uniref:Uncharacterized protein n=1 Tax=Streblomastix strix TaxID=222440 RepID=A0A5J4WL88_9EUKA|nr:MAG: hypothetical protein EZS28_009074 [Streblomastix strix]
MKFEHQETYMRTPIQEYFNGCYLTSAVVGLVIFLHTECVNAYFEGKKLLGQRRESDDQFNFEVVKLSKRLIVLLIAIAMPFWRIAPFLAEPLEDEIELPTTTTLALTGSPMGFQSATMQIQQVLQTPTPRSRIQQKIYEKNQSRKPMSIIQRFSSLFHFTDGIQHPSHKMRVE